MWIAGGFAAAAFLAEYLLPVRGLPYLAAALALCGAVCVPLKRMKARPKAMLLLFSAAAGLLYWWGWFELRVAPCEALAGQNVTLTVRVTDYPLETERYTRLSVTVLDGAPRERGYLYVYDDEVPALAPGDVISAEVRLLSVMTRGEERSHTLTAAGRYLRGYARSELAVVGRSGAAWRWLPQRVSRWVSESCETLFPGRSGVFMKALLTGDKHDLYEDPELYGDMRASGVLHAVAVSGMHVFLLIGALQFVFGKGRVTTLLCYPVLLFFVFMSGAGASVVRAAVMQAIYMSAPLVKRESDSPSALAAALLLLLLCNPLSVGGIALQLSFACMAGYAVFMPRFKARVHRSKHHDSPVFRTSYLNLAATFSATAFSLPVAAFYFGAVPLLAWLANLIALPVLGLVFAGGYALCALYALLPALAAPLAWVLDWGVKWCFLVFRCVGRLPFACLYTADPKAVVWLVLLYALPAAWFLLRKRGIRMSPAIPAELLLMALCAVFLWNEAALRLGRRDFAVLDVGQGACSVLFDRDVCAVIDCGGSDLRSAGDIAADYLRAAGVDRVDVLVLTHLDDDHVNGVPTLLYRLPVGLVILPDTASEADRMAIEAAAIQAGAETLTLADDTAAVLGDLTLTLRRPLPEGSDNDSGIVVEASYPGFTALVMGDAGEKAELALLRQGSVPDADVLVVGHHGSASSSGALFLRAAQAETAVVSVGTNSYGQPASDTLDRLARYCETTLRTDENGSVVFHLGTEVPSWRE